MEVTIVFISGGLLFATKAYQLFNSVSGFIKRNKKSFLKGSLFFGGELSPLCELRKSDKGAASLDCFSVSFTDSIELLCFLSGSEK